MSGRRIPSKRISRSAVMIAFAAAVMTPPRASPAPESLRYELSGCGAILADGSCERPSEGDVRLWVDTQAPVSARIDGSEVTLPATPIRSGTRLSLRAPARGEHRATTHVEVRAGNASAAFDLVDPPSWTWLTDATRARARGDHEAVRRFASARLEDPEPAVRARAEALVARADLAQGKIGNAIALLGRASRDAELAGRISDAVDDALALSFTLSQRAGRYDEARAELDRIEPLAAKYPDGRARVPYYHALVAAELGDMRAATRDLRLARERAERLGLPRLVWNIRNEWALSLERMGRHSEAIAELTALASSRDAEVTACERANVLHNLGFGLLLRNRERGTSCSKPAPREAAAKWLTDSLALSQRECPDAFRTAMGHVLLGEAALDEDRVDEAERELARSEIRDASSSGASNELRRRRLDLEGRIALTRGDGKRALARYEELALFARASGRVDDERRALEGKGEALERLGRTAGADDAFAQAEDLLAAASALVPLGEASFYRGARETASRARVELLRKSGRPREALAVARRARVRLLSSVASIERLADVDPEARSRWAAAARRYRDERKKLDAEGARDWELATSELVRVVATRKESLARLRAALDEALSALPRLDAELPPIADGDGTLLFAMTARDSVVAFVARNGDVRALDVAARPTDERALLARSIVLGAAPELEGARSVRVVTSADLACLDLHAVAIGDDAPIGLRVPVAYGFDLGGATAAPAQRVPAALVVSDTQNDLPLARDEGKIAEARLATEGPVTHLSGARADGPAVLEALAKATSLHYAGHGEDFEGEIALPLAAGGRLTASDVLALPMSPERVVLSACEAGRIDATGLALGMGLVQTFLEKGAREVLAPSRPVRDEVARELASSLSGAAPEDRLRAFQSLVKSRPDADWAAYRVWRR